MKGMRTLFLWVAMATIVAAPVTAQVPAADPSTRLREVLPADVAERVIARIAEARARALPAPAVAALENRALKFAARGIAPADVERAVSQHADRMMRSREAIESARTARASGEEIDAGAEAMRQGVDGAAVSELAKTAPSGRSLAVPLFVLGQLVERGLPSDDALERVRERLTARASDRDLERMPADAARERAGDRGANAPGRDRVSGTSVRPNTVPVQGGRPTLPTRPVEPERPTPRRP